MEKPASIRTEAEDVEASTSAASGRIGRRSIARPLLRLRSDDQLVLLVRAGSDEAFGAIHDRYQARLATYARLMLDDAADVEDMVQDVFLHAYRILRSEARPLELDTWLFGMVHSRCVAQPERPLPVSDDVLKTSRSPAPDPFAEVERQEDARRALADLRFLTENQRSALLMCEIDGMSYSQLADALEMSVPAVRALLMRARVGLVEHVAARDADCDEIRKDLLDAYDSRVRPSRRARRHLRSCSACASVRRRLFAVRRSLAALSPSAGIAKLPGFGGGGSSAPGGGGALLGGGASLGIGHIAVAVCCVAGVGGAAVAIDGGGRPERAAPVTPVTHVRSQRAHSTTNRDKDIVASPQIAATSKALRPWRHPRSPRSMPRRILRRPRFSRAV